MNTMEDIKRLAEQFTEEQLEYCFDREIATGENDCRITSDISEVMDILLKTEDGSPKSEGATTRQ